MANETNSDPDAPRDEVRSVPFEPVRAADGDGLTLEGYAAVFNKPTRINSWEGEFDEVIAPGAFAKAIRSRKPVLMFEHGQHPLLGSMPLGKLRTVREDNNGLFISARLSDNWLIQPVRDAVRDGAVSGMSFRFSVKSETWEERPRKARLRTITEFASVPELGPVVFPAYEPTTASIRSLVERLEIQDIAEETVRDLAHDLDEIAAGKPDTRSAGSDDDTQPGNGERSPDLRTRDRVLRYAQRTQPSWL